MYPMIIRVSDDDTLETISNKYNIPVSILKKYNEVDSVEEGDRLIIPFDVKVLHIVKPLQTLNDIAILYNTNPQKIKEDNNITQALFVGQQLLIM